MAECIKFDFFATILSVSVCSYGLLLWMLFSVVVIFQCSYKQIEILIVNSYLSSILAEILVNQQQ